MKIGRSAIEAAKVIAGGMVAGGTVVMLGAQDAIWSMLSVLTSRRDWLPYLTLAGTALGSMAIVVVALVNYRTQGLLRHNTQTAAATADRVVQIAVSVDGRVSQLLEKSDAVIAEQKDMIAALRESLALARARAESEGAVNDRTGTGGKP